MFRKRPLHKISKEKRKIFHYLDKKPYETGGYMDFNKKGLEQVKLYYGAPGSVDIPVSSDYEVDWHTHIRDKDRRLNRINQFPSKRDIKTFDDYRSQAMVIFHNNKATITTKTPKFKINSRLLNKIDKNLGRDSFKLSTDQLYKKYKPEYGKMGLDVKYIKHNRAIKIPIDVVEPIKKRKLSRYGWFSEPDDLEDWAEREKYGVKAYKEIEDTLPEFRERRVLLPEEY